MLKEWVARIVVLLLVVIAVAVPVVGWWTHWRLPILHARIAEAGGWMPESLTAEVGIPLHLRLTSDDVMHSFAVGQMGQPPVDVIPGQVSEVTLVFDKPGKYVFYCTRWCSLSHWRMRGTIDVRGSANETAQVQQPPLYVTLGLDIDAQIQAKNLPGRRPSAVRGELLAGQLAEVYTAQDYYRAHSPEEVWQDLRLEASLKSLGADDLWDLVAWIWQQNTTPQRLAEGRGLYAVNCAACHGESGKGDGVFAGMASQPTNVGDMNTQPAGNGIKPPVDFTDAVHMLAASPARLQGKIIRGGMGTGMPYWGPIFTDDQIWNLVAYLSTFQFDYNMEVK